MIDFVKLHWRDKVELENFVLKAGSFKEVEGVIELHSGEVRYPFTTEKYGMRVILTKTTGSFRNSIHKSHNLVGTGRSQNYNDFCYSDICEHIDFLCKEFKGNLESGRITQLEFGFNLSLDVSVRELIRQEIVMHQFKGANHNIDFNGTGELKQFDYSTYLFKIYDKGRQYNVAENILRVELKFIKARELQGLDIYHLEDLKDRKKLRMLFKVLLKRFNELTIIDDYEESEINCQDDLGLLIKYSNPMFWEVDYQSCNWRDRRLHRDSFERILNEYNLKKTKEILLDKLKGKYVALMRG